MPKLTFGKYQDYDISDPIIETSYLEWLEKNARGITHDMVIEELKRRSEGAVGTS